MVLKYVQLIKYNFNKFYHITSLIFNKIITNINRQTPILRQKTDPCASIRVCASIRINAVACVQER